MKSPFTLDDLFLFALNETELSDENFIRHEMEDSSMKNEMKEMLGIDKSDDRSAVSPDKRIISNIMSYSRALNVVRTKHAGNINLLMN